MGATGMEGRTSVARTVHCPHPRMSPACASGWWALTLCPPPSYSPIIPWGRTERYGRVQSRALSGHTRRQILRSWHCNFAAYAPNSDVTQWHYIITNMNSGTDLLSRGAEVVSDEFLVSRVDWRRELQSHVTQQWWAAADWTASPAVLHLW